MPPDGTPTQDQAPAGYLILWQLTAPRTVQAIMVMMFSMAAVFLVLTGDNIPELFGWIVASIVGYYFNAEEGNPYPLSQGVVPPTLNEIRKNVAPAEGQSADNSDESRGLDDATNPDRS